MRYTKWKIDRHDEIDSSNRIVLRISTEFEPSKENINQLKKRISKTDEMYEALKLAKSNLRYGIQQIHDLTDFPEYNDTNYADDMQKILIVIESLLKELEQ